MLDKKSAEGRPENAAGWVEPLLARYGVQLYLAGHDHDLEHIQVPGAATHHIVSGAGSQTRPLAGTADACFQHGSQGAGLIAQDPLSKTLALPKPADLFGRRVDGRTWAGMQIRTAMRWLE